MSKLATYQVNCSSCGKQSDFDAWASINVQLDSELKEKLLKRELFMFKCFYCGEETSIIYPCLYHDMERKVMIQFCASEGLEESIKGLKKSIEIFEKNFPKLKEKWSYEYRIVTNLNDLNEKIFIFDSELNDKVIEIIKFSLKCNLKTEKAIDKLYYSKEKSDGFVVFSGDEIIGRVDIPDGMYTEYEKIYKSLKLKDDEKYCVNESWAIRIIGANK